MPVSVTVKVDHCADGDGPFDGQIGVGTHSVRQCKFDVDGDCDGDGDRDCMCKCTSNPFIATITFTNLLYRNDLFLVSHTVYISFDIL